jgi:MtaA/CmuA family methyltransferase
MKSRQRFFAHLNGEPADRPLVMPITMMFASRHVGVPYLQYATNHRILAETQARTALDFGFDHVSVISDPGREAADCGAVVKYYEDQPPALDEADSVLADKTRLLDLQIPDPMGGGRMTDRVEAVRMLHMTVGEEKIVEGWVEGPIAEAADLRGINRIMLDFYEDPEFVRDLFEFVLEMELLFARAQVEAGADIVGVGDAAASLVGPAFYQDYIWPAQKRLIEGIQETGAGVRLHICGNTNHHFEGIKNLGCEIVDLDYKADIQRARDVMGPGQMLLGNIDPVSVLRDGDPDLVWSELEKCYQAAAPRYIVSAGCEVPRDTPEENVRVFLEFAESKSTSLFSGNLP